MGPAVFVIAIMGCADGGSSCTPLETLPARYVSESACSQASNAALEHGLRYDYPTIVAQCQSAPRERSADRGTPRRTDRGRSG